jgi:hypothetical protein
MSTCRKMAIISENPLHSFPFIGPLITKIARVSILKRSSFISLFSSLSFLIFFFLFRYVLPNYKKIRIAVSTRDTGTDIDVDMRLREREESEGEADERVDERDPVTEDASGAYSESADDILDERDVTDLRERI